MEKIELKDFLERSSSTNQKIKLIEYQYNGHSFVICEHVKAWELLQKNKFLHRIVCSWDTYEIGNPYKEGQLNVYVYLEGVTNEKELTLFCIKKYLEPIGKGIITLDREEVQCTAYSQPNFGYGYIWFVYTQKGSKKEELKHYRGDDYKALELVNQLNSIASWGNSNV